MTTDAAPPLTPEDAAQYLPEALRRPPIFDLLLATEAGKRQLQLIRTRVARGATDSELAQFLELCAQYGLDWNADEAWCAVSNPDNPDKRRVLLMVGRNGLRKIAQRQGLDFDGDVVRANDTFRVTRKGDRTREIVHEYEEGADDESRGAMRGAWCEVYEVATGRQRGYFYARVIEYRPTGAKLQYSPWGSQESVMMQTAAERQALGQATPLGGIVGQGELDRVEETAALTAGAGDGSAPDVEVPEDVAAVIERARGLGHASLSNAASVMMAVGALTDEQRAMWVKNATQALDEFEARKAEEEPPEADVVDAPAATEPSRDPRAHVGHQVSVARLEGAPDGLHCEDCDVTLDTDAVVQDEPEPERGADEVDARVVGQSEHDVAAGAIQAMRDRAERLEQDAEAAKAAGKEDESAMLYGEAGQIREQIAEMQPDGGGDDAPATLL